MVAQAKIVVPPRTAFPPAPFASRLVLTETIHPSVHRYESDAQGVREALELLPKILEGLGFVREANGGTVQKYKTYENKEREDRVVFWHRGEQHLFVSSAIYPDNEQGSSFALDAHFDTREAEVLLKTIDRRMTIAEMAKIRHVLLVDDNAHFREEWNEAMKGKGYACETAAGAREALDILATQPVDLVMLDFGMENPRDNAFDLVPKIRERDPTISIVLLSGLVSTELLRHYSGRDLRDETDGYITKGSEDILGHMLSMIHLLEARRAERMEKEFALSKRE